MYYKVLLALSMVVLSFNCLLSVGNDKELVSMEQKKHSGLPNENIAVSIVKKIKNGDSLDRDELVFINTLWISSLTFGILNGWMATSRFHLQAKESLCAAGIGAAMGFLVGIPAAYFNYSEWYD